MIFITGDMHGDLKRFKSKDMRKLKKNDYLIICGDFGFIWDGSEKERKILQWIGKRPYNVLFLEGTHDNLDLIHKYDQVEWNNGKVREISGKLKYLCRGEIFTIENSSYFVFGGGSSTDIESRTVNETWWSNELPSLDEIDLARAKLYSLNNKVDYIITHQPSGKIRSFLFAGKYETTLLDNFFDDIRINCKFKRWFFSSVHLDKIIPPTETSVFRYIHGIND